jgi:hypothetical protein
MTASPEETCVVLGVEFRGISRDQLEDYAALIQESVDERAGEAAPDAAVRCTYEPLGVELLFTVENESMAEVHQRVAAVVAAIQAALPVAFDTDTATRSAPRRRRSLVPVPA